MNDISAIPTSARDRHLFGPGPKKLLALDGGGVRGAISVAFLERIEEILCAQHGEDYRLSDAFDLIGGTSTGAIISGALALGYRATDLKNFYLERAHLAFKRSFWRVPGLQAKFDARLLRQEIDAILQNRTLDTADLRTGFCVVSKRMDTGSPWILANNPRAPYWETPPDRSFIGNRHFRLATLVRASTAAPHFFDPEILPIVEPKVETPQTGSALVDRSFTGRWIMTQLARIRLWRRAMHDPATHGMFIDGGVTPHNNPALALYLMCTLSPYGIGWPTGPDKLSVVSVGTGSHRSRLSFAELGFAGNLKLAIHALLSLMQDSETLVLSLMQWLGECPDPWKINSEIGKLLGEQPPGGKQFRFHRYNVRLEPDWLKRKLDLNVTERDARRFRTMDDPAIVRDIYEIGRLAARYQVKPEHWKTSS